ncbi:MAG: competence/damage-inducible protein A [bacterium]|jgi:molybdopterin-biosynthesis enzyme MoeA-like protein
MSFGLIIIGDEILSGKREDKHLCQIIQLLTRRGLALSWAHYLPDDFNAITEYLKRSLNGNDIVFCTGGIGATPDDHTRQAAAAAAEVALSRHAEAARSIELRVNEIAQEKGLPSPVDMNSEENQQRLHMADLPQGCELIPNAYNKIPGFSIGQHYFMPGFPVMAWPMVEWVLDTKYAHLFHKNEQRECSVIVFGAFEASLTPLMNDIERRFRDIKVFSLPSVGDSNQPAHIELGVKGPIKHVDLAFGALLDALAQLPKVRLGDKQRR